MIDRLFTYGTLEIPAVFHAVTARECRHEPARLPGYARFLVRGECFPGIAAREGHDTSGTLYFDVDPVTLARIDRFEGPQFRRERVEVVTPKGRNVSAWVYVVSPEDLSALPWDPTTFLSDHLQDFLNARSAWIE